VSGTGIVCENTNFHSSKTDSSENKNIVSRKRKSGGRKKEEKKEVPVLVPH